jgi:hypothetical protein
MYYYLMINFHDGNGFQVDFGDYDRKVVREELEDRLFDTPRKDMKVVIESELAEVVFSE